MFHEVGSKKESMRLSVKLKTNFPARAQGMYYSVRSFSSFSTSGFVFLLKSNGFRIYPAISK